jgi:hypothetical protein
LDFFVLPSFRDRPEEPRLPGSEVKDLASEDEVRSFLEKQCHLSRRTPVPRNEAEQHHDAFNVWGRWVENGTIIAPFCVVHVDAHSDLGSGWNNRSFTFIETELLALPIEQRRHPAFGPEHLNSGNYLLVAIANRWISQLTYCYPVARTASEAAQHGTLPRFEDGAREIWAEQEPPVSDLPAWIFRNDDWRTRIIELKHRVVRHGVLEYGQPMTNEPPVPFKWIEGREFTLAGVTHMFLARSPEYTPAEADELLPIIREYFYSV